MSNRVKKSRLNKEEPMFPVKKLAGESGPIVGSVLAILKSLHFHPYKLSQTQELYENHFRILWIFVIEAQIKSILKLDLSRK